MIRWEGRNVKKRLLTTIEEYRYTKQADHASSGRVKRYLAYYMERNSMPAYTNKLEQPQHLEGTILGKAPGRKVIGTIRVKPSSILWKPSGQAKYYSVPLNEFTAWIKSKKTGASRTTN